MFVIQSSDKTRYPRYYSGPTSLKSLQPGYLKSDSGPFGGQNVKTKFQAREEAEILLAELQELYLSQHKWNRAEVMDAKIVEL